MSPEHFDDAVLFVGRVVTLDPSLPEAEAVLIGSGRILRVGGVDELRAHCAPDTLIIDGAGGLVLPAFHDAHLHLLKYARAQSKLDCSGIDSVHQLQSMLRDWSGSLAPDAWLRGWAYDEKQLAEGQHPSRADLDAAAPDRPLRLEHRSLHLDLFNTVALRHLGLLDYSGPELERDPMGQPTGRLYDGGQLLKARHPRPSRCDTARAVRSASERLLAWGVTTVQDASMTNGREEWDMFHDLAHSGDLGVRLVFLPGGAHWRSVVRARPATQRVRLGPIKIMVGEGVSDPQVVLTEVDAAHAGGRSVAIHAVSEAELAIALFALAQARPNPGPARDRIEHAATIPDDMLHDVRAAGVTLVGQPGLIYERGTHYLRDHPPEQHGWLHRARSVLTAGIPYAAGSDAPVTVPNPTLTVRGLLERRARSGDVLSPSEVLSLKQALAATTRAPALAIGASDLGMLRVGAAADLVVLDSGWLTGPAGDAPVAQLTMMEGHIVWSNGELGSHTAGQLERRSSSNHSSSRPCRREGAAWVKPTER